MKALTFAPEHGRHFYLAYSALHSDRYQFQSRDDLRNHGKLLDAFEAASVEDTSAAGRRLADGGPHQLVLDDAWLALLRRMATPPNIQWLPGSTRDVEAMLTFLDTAVDYIAPKPTT